MRQSKLKAIVVERHISYDALARGAGISFSSASKAVCGLVPGPVTRTKIAGFLGMTEDSIWPLAAEAIARRAQVG